MKIDSAKTNDANRRSETSKTGDSLRPSIYQTAKILETPPPTSSAFARILEEARKNSAKDHETTLTREKEHTEESSKTSGSDGDDDSPESISRREEVDEKERRQGESKGESGESGDQSAFAAAGFFFENRNVRENSSPPARSILHVADLERIVSAIRSQNIAGTRELLLTLKISVLEGLQIKISLDENGKYKAEFLAGSEQVKKQIEARKGELAQIFSERGLHFTGLDVKQNPDFSGKNQSEQHFENSTVIKNESGETSETPEISPDENLPQNEEGTFYRT